MSKIKMMPQNVVLEVQKPGIEGVYEMIEKCARVCYQSSPSSRSSEDFVKGLMSRGHGRPLEFGTVYLTVYGGNPEMYMRYTANPFSDVVMTDKALYVTTNLRVVMQGNSASWEDARKRDFDEAWTDDLAFLSDRSDFHMERLCFRLTVSKETHAQLKTHSRISSMGESTRFCNYSLGKFEGSLAVVPPWWYGSEGFEDESERFTSHCERCFGEYLRCIEAGMKPEDARAYLPKYHRTETVMCGSVKDWRNFLWVRTDPHAQREIREVALRIAEHVK